MDKKKLLECIEFFKRLNVVEDDITTEEESLNGQKVVIVKYQIDGKVFETKKLYYRDILNLENIKNKDLIIKYFGGPVYWLDLQNHGWPQPSGESDLDKLVINDMTQESDLEFKIFLKRLANNQLTGFIQKISADGRSGQYYHNLENNNHWHDLVYLIKAIIASGGKEIDKKYFSRLVFKWDGSEKTIRERSTLTNKAYWCSRSLVDTLHNNIKLIQLEIKDMEIVNLLKYKMQIILQGPPGTGKTYTAKEIAYSMVFDKTISREEKQKKEEMMLLEDSGQYKLIQFHPAFTYEDFVRGIVSKITIHNQVEFKVENKMLAEFAQKALGNPSAKYVLIIDEINRANLPAVLGELIYALEYRFDDDNPGGTTVESMYALKGNEADVEGDRKLRLPINLYIIGTMNTADRSIGHIDYAIRRRFAFVNFPPRKSVIDEVIKDDAVKQKAHELYDKVESLFGSKTLASDFNKNDVQIGHSYFLAKTLDELNLKTIYEIKPILKEYLKDGILLSNFNSDGKDLTLEFIENL